MRCQLLLASLSMIFLVPSAFPQEAQLLQDLESKQPAKLSKDELQQLLPGAKMSSTNSRGNTRAWANDPDGTFTSSNDNHASSHGRPSYGQGKWRISDDGRYCVVIDWQRADTEQWCRFIIRTTDGYYAARSDKGGAEKVHKLTIDGK